MNLVGRWRIDTMDLWDRDAIDLVEPGFIEFGAGGTGQFGFIAVRGWLDCRTESRGGRSRVEFSWQGDDKGDDVRGGWAPLRGDGTLDGHLILPPRRRFRIPGRPVRPCRGMGCSMSVYQYYEFLALDRPLDTHQQDELRALSTRARINATSFINEYHWGSFRGDPSRLMERYYDAHLYLANWGSRRIMLRFPRTLLDPDVAEQYCVSDQVTAWTADEFIVLDLASGDDSGEWVEDGERSLSAIVGVRAEIAAGDLRPLYLAWLAGYGKWERDEDAFDREHDDELEPPVPPGLATLTASQQALADFLRLDDDLLNVAATTSPPLEDATNDPREFAGWITNLSPAEKDRLLLRVVSDHPATVRTELLRRFREQSTPAVPPVSRRTVADLLDTAARTRADKEARRKKIQALARERRLDELAHGEEKAWARIDTMIATKKPGEYDAAVMLLTELRALAERDGRPDEFARRSIALRQTHSRKPSLIERLNRAGIGTNHNI